VEDSLRILEDAYIGARYLAKTYERVDVEKALRAVEELFRVIEVVEHNVFS
jgi:HEPN domain-containing protein